MTPRFPCISLVTVLLGVLTAPHTAPAQLWPDEQVLPSFPSPAATQDLIVLTQPANELALFASLKGIINRTQPRIFSYEGDAFAEGRYTWLESLGLQWAEPADRWTLITKYRDEIAGLVVYDPTLPDTLNLATTMAGQLGALVAPPELVAQLTSASYSLTVLEDLQGDFPDKLAVYQALYDAWWPSAPQRVILGLNPAVHLASAREYAVALGAAVIWLDPAIPQESALLNQFLMSMDERGVFMGWWPDEAMGIERASTHGIATVPSDFSTSLTLHGAMPRTVDVKPIPPKPILQNKLYVAFILSDGDNLQYVEHLMRKLWNDPGRGQVPIGWTVSPAMLDAMPGALNYYYTSASALDALVSGPSGLGYVFPNSVPTAALQRYLAASDEYALRAGLRVVTVWNTITGGIDTEVGAGYASNAPALLGVTAQNTGGGLTVYAGSLPSFALSCNYCTNEQAINDHISSASADWDGTAPGFILIQAQPWQGVTPTSFLNVQNSLSDDYVVVRPDNWFQLLRQANGLPIEPALRVANGLYRLINEGSGKCVTALGDGGVGQTECADDGSQRWQVTDVGAGYREIAPESDPSLVISVAGGAAATEDEIAITLSPAAGTADQRWQTVWVSGASYRLFAEHSERCIDVPAGVTDDVQLQQLTCSSEAAQRFQFADPDWPPDNGPMMPEPEPPVQEPPVEQPGDTATMPPTTGSPVDPTDPNQPVAAAGASSESPTGAHPASDPQPEVGSNSGCACSAATHRFNAGPVFVGWLIVAAAWMRRRTRFKPARAWFMGPMKAEESGDEHAIATLVPIGLFGGDFEIRFPIDAFATQEALDHWPQLGFERLATPEVAQLPLRIE